MTVYSPTVSPGDTRRRCRYLGIRTPLDTRTDEQKAEGVPAPVPIVEVLEQEVIRTANGERVLEDLGALPVGAFDPTESFPLLDPETDAPLGGDATVGQAFAIIYSWVRAKQAQRDADLALQAAALAQPPLA